MEADQKRISQQQRYREENPGDSELEQNMMQDRFSAYGDSLGVGSSGRNKAYGDIADDGDAKKPKIKASGEDDVDVEGTEARDSFFEKASSSSDKLSTPTKTSTGATKAVASPAAAAPVEKGSKAQKSTKAPKASAKGKPAAGGRGRPAESRKELVSAGLRQLRYSDGSAIFLFACSGKCQP